MEGSLRDQLQIHDFELHKLFPVISPSLLKADTRLGRKRLTENDRVFIHWLIRVLEGVQPDRPEGYQYNALAIYMCGENLNLLSKLISPFVYLDIAPRQCDELTDQEYGIDVENVLKENPCRK